jgi:transposase-like protein
MVRRERKLYTEELRTQVLAAYNNSDESATDIARRFQINQDTIKSWGYRKRTLESCSSSKIVTFAISEMNLMKKQIELSPEQMKVRIREMERRRSRSGISLIQSGKSAGNKL